MRRLPSSVTLKIDLLFEGVRYTPALSAAMDHAFRNHYPYRFAEGEEDPTGTGQAAIPFLLQLADGTLIRIMGRKESPYHVVQVGAGYELRHDRGDAWPITFAPRHDWVLGTCTDGQPMSQIGLELLGDLLVVNLAPGCQFFTLPKRDGRPQRCAFCLYGRPDARSAALGQDMDSPLLPEWSLRRMQEGINAAVAEGRVRHVYLVAGCLADPEQEAQRYLQLARAVREGCPDVPYLSCGSGALPESALRTLHAEQLVDGVCFNLEVHGEDLFRLVCPGKATHYGYDFWIRSLEQAVGLWGMGNVYSAMVAGIELEPQILGLELEPAVERALAGAEDLVGRGILPIYSLYLPLYGKDHYRTLLALREYFSRVSLGYQEIRQAHGLTFNPAFMCRGCSYMQVECDLDDPPQTSVPSISAPADRS